MRCRKCEVEQSEELFPWKNKAAGKRQTICKECLKAYGRSNYQANKERYKVNRDKNKPKYVDRNGKYILDHLSKNPCVDCGESDPVVLQFDHVRGKTWNVSQLLSNSLERLKEEIALCDVRCANCHMRRTGSMYGWRVRL